MTKEEKAKEYAKGKVIDLELCTITIENEARDSFLSGYIQAEQDSEEMMCKFAEWVKSATLRADGLLIFSTPQEILLKFKESLKQ